MAKTKFWQRLWLPVFIGISGVTVTWLLWQVLLIQQAQIERKVVLVGCLVLSILLGLAAYLIQRTQRYAKQVETTNEALANEIAQRQQIQAGLHESEERYRDLFENANDLIQSITPNGQITYTNRAWQETLGYSEAEIANLTMLDIIHPDCQAHCMEMFGRVMSGEKLERVEADFITKDGKKVSLEGSINCKIVDGKPTSTRGIFRDVTERKQTEKILQETTTLQRAILNSANYTIISTTVDGIITTFNTAAERSLGYSAAEMIGLTPEIIHAHQEIVKRSQELSQELGVIIEPGFEVFVAKARQGQIEEQEWSYIRKDGSRFPVLLSVTALQDAQGNITGFLGIGSDITERKQAEAALRESEARFYEAFEYAAIGMALVSPNGCWLQVNRSLCEITGYSEAELLATTFQAITHPDDLQIDLNYVQQMLSGETRSYQMEKRYLHKNGNIVWVLLNVALVRDGHGQPLYFVSQIQDITERKQAEEELRNLSNALESAVEGISQLDTQGRYISANRAYANMVGYQPEEMFSWEWWVTVHPEDIEKMRFAYQQMLSSGKVEVEARALRKDGSTFDMQVVMIKAYDQKQQFIGHYCFMKDISERREIERLKSEFVSIVSHELRTPLTSIRGSLGLLASGVLQSQPEKGQKMLDIAVSNTDRLVRLINDILDIERIESGKVQMTKQVCDAEKLMTQSADVMRDMADKAGVSLSVAPISAKIWADPDRIIQMLTNLLSNAIKFSNAGSTVWLTAEVRTREQDSISSPSLAFSSSDILFQIKDQGRGIPAEKIEQIFDRFQQVDASDSRQKGGTGLGLAICRSIVQHHGGKIWAESTLGEGSTFFITLPIMPAEKPAAQAIAHSNHSLVLVCDDDPSVRTVVQNILEHQGYQVITAASGQEAIHQVDQQQPDVILLNLMMPGMHGWETLAILKQQPHTKNIPVIILSGLSPDPTQSPHPISDWIVKPPDEQLLFQALQQALNKHSQDLKVLIVEDDVDLAQVLISIFERHSIETFHAQSGREAIRLSQMCLPDLLVLDLVLPEVDGFSVVEWLKQHNRLCQVPLVMYTAKDLDQSERERLKLGQTVYLTKSRITPEKFEQRVIDLLNRIMQV